jgi:DNA polymerase
MVDHVLEIMAYHSLELVEWYFGDALLAISGCIRGLFIAGDGMELIASDYSAIEAVVIAMLAGEEWRIQAFRDKIDIYLASAAKITGGSVAAYEAYALEHGENHPDRQKIGKVAELGLGFGGWIGAWRVFDDSDTFTDDEVKKLILAWRESSPKIVELWGGQWRGPPWDGYRERFGFEGAAVNAIEYPGQIFTHAGITFEVRGYVAPTTEIRRDYQGNPYESYVGGYPGTMIVTLLSGRELTYHEPRLEPSTRDYAAPGEMSISYMTWNQNPKMGALGWVRMSTFGGRLTENIVQAIAHDLLRYAILALRAAGFPTVLHVYDEIVAEIPKGAPAPPGMVDARLQLFERLMAALPWWAVGWPVRASGGWIGRRFRKG